MNPESNTSNILSLPTLQTNFPFSHQLTDVGAAIAAPNATGSTSNTKNAPIKWKPVSTRQLGDPRALQEFQIECLTNWLNEEVQSHNNTRAHATYLNTTTLRYERDLCHEQTTVRSLTTTIHNLRTRVEQETDLRLQAEGALEIYASEILVRGGGDRVRQVHDQRPRAPRISSKQETPAPRPEEQPAQSVGTDLKESKGKSIQHAGRYLE